MSRRSFQERLFRALLWCYPGEFRDEYGVEMASVFRRRARSEPLWALWPEVFADVLITGLREHLSVLNRDLRYTARMLVKAPVFSLAAMLTLALGMGVSLAIFSVLNSVVLQPLPFRDPPRLVSLWGAFRQSTDRRSVSVPNYVSWRAESKSFESMAAFWTLRTSLQWTGNGEPERLACGAFTASTFDLLGIRPVLGRSFSEDDEKRGAPSIAMLSEDFWRQRFGGDPTVLGRALELDGVSHRIIGVAPATLALFDRPDLWIPVTMESSREQQRGTRVLSPIARLRPGASAHQAEAELKAVAARLEQTYPATNTGWGARMESVVDSIMPARTRTALIVLFGAVMLVLLVAWANVANLLMARAGERSREIAMRLAIGAGRSRLARQFLTESVFLAVAGGIAGTIVGYWTVTAFRQHLPQDLPRRGEIGLDATALAFAFAIVVFSGVLFAVVPLTRARRGDLAQTLRGGAHGMARDRSFARRALVAVEVCLATILVAGASLLFQTFAGLQKANLGFDPRHLLTAQISLAQGKYPYLPAAFFYSDLLARLNSSPGVVSAAISSGIPFGAGDQTTTQAFATTAASAPLAEQAVVSWRSVSRDYFKTMRTPLLRGRSFTPSDERKDSPDVVIVSSALARQIWPGQDALGKELISNGRKRVVIGIAADSLLDDRRDARPACAYYLAPWFGWPTMTVVLRTRGNPEDGLPLLRARVKELDPGVALFNVRTMEQWLSVDEATPRTNALLMSVFAVIALVLALVGLYGVVSYTVSHRTAEIAIRMALGATKPDVVRLVVGQALFPVLVGLIGGLGCTAALGRAFSTLLFGVAPWDVQVSVGTSAILFAAALIACILPTMRAVQIDPADALRKCG